MLRNIWVISLLNIYRLSHHKIPTYKRYICKGLTIHKSNSYFCKQPETSKFFDQKIQDFCSKKFDNPIFFYILKLIFTLSSVVFDYWFTISTLQKSKFVLSFWVFSSLTIGIGEKVVTMFFVDTILNLWSFLSVAIT